MGLNLQILQTNLRLMKMTRSSKRRVLNTRKILINTEVRRAPTTNLVRAALEVLVSRMVILQLPRIGFFKLH